MADGKEGDPPPGSVQFTNEKQVPEYHVHLYDRNWKCKCGFVLPLELRPEQRGFPMVSGNDGNTVASPRSYVDMDTWFRNMKEYAPLQQADLARRSSGFGQWPYRWQRLDDKNRI